MAYRGGERGVIAWSALIGAWLAGALGGMHCLAMCGGFLSALSTTGPAVAPLHPARALAWRQLPYNVGRVTTYTLLGALAGGAGAAVTATAALLPLQRGLYVLANVMLLALAWFMLGRGDRLVALQRAGARVFAAVRPIMRPLLARQFPTARFALGLLWGLVPCAMTYAVLPVALFAGSAWQGGLVMLAFGLGTLPNVLAAGWLVARGRPWLDRATVRVGAAALLGAFALVGIWRAFGDPAALAQNPFCLVH